MLTAAIAFFMKFVADECAAFAGEAERVRLIHR